MKRLLREPFLSSIPVELSRGEDIRTCQESNEAEDVSIKEIIVDAYEEEPSSLWDSTKMSFSKESTKTIEPSSNVIAVTARSEVVGSTSYEVKSFKSAKANEKKDDDLEAKTVQGLIKPYHDIKLPGFEIGVSVLEIHGSLSMDTTFSDLISSLNPHENGDVSVVNAKDFLGPTNGNFSKQFLTEDILEYSLDHRSLPLNSLLELDLINLNGCILLEVHSFEEEKVLMENYYESFITSELSLIDDQVKFLPAPFLSANKVLKSKAMIMEDIFNALKPLSFSVCDEIYLAWHPLSEVIGLILQSLNPNMNRPFIQILIS